MIYNNLREYLKNNKICDLDAEITACVNAACPKYVSDEEFDLLCDFCRTLFTSNNLQHIQLVADIVCDLYLNLDYGYRVDDEDDFFMTSQFENGKWVNRTHNYELTRSDFTGDNWVARQMVANLYSNKYEDMY